MCQTFVTIHQDITFGFKNSIKEYKNKIRVIQIYNMWHIMGMFKLIILKKFNAKLKKLGYVKIFSYIFRLTTLLTFLLCSSEQVFF